MEALRIAKIQDVVLLTLPKEITIPVGHEVRATLNELLDANGFEALVVDMSRLQAINSAGIGLLVSFKTKCAAAKKTLYLAAPPAPVLKTLQLVQMEAIFNFAESAEALLRERGLSA